MATRVDKCVVFPALDLAGQGVSRAGLDLALFRPRPPRALDPERPAVLWGEQSPPPGRGSLERQASWGLPGVGTAGCGARGDPRFGLMAQPRVRGLGDLVCLCGHS